MENLNGWLEASYSNIKPFGETELHYQDINFLWPKPKSKRQEVIKRLIIWKFCKPHFHWFTTWYMDPTTNDPNTYGNLQHWPEHPLARSSLKWHKYFKLWRISNSGEGGLINKMFTELFMNLLWMSSLCWQAGVLIYPSMYLNCKYSAWQIMEAQKYFSVNEWL